MEINVSVTLGLTQHFEQLFSVMKVTSGCSHHREIGIADYVAIILQKKKQHAFKVPFLLQYASCKKKVTHFSTL